MFRYLAAALILHQSAAIAADQGVTPGSWDVTSTVVDFSVPGVPGFIVRMLRGRSTAEHKRLNMGQGAEALIVPDPKAHCHVERQRIENGQYAQALTCPRKQGEPVHIARAGTYDTTGFVGRATVSGTTPKGPMSIVLSQRAARVGD